MRSRGPARHGALPGSSARLGPVVGFVDSHRTVTAHDVTVALRRWQQASSIHQFTWSPPSCWPATVTATLILRGSEQSTCRLQTHARGLRYRVPAITNPKFHDLLGLSSHWLMRADAKLLSSQAAREPLVVATQHARRWAQFRHKERRRIMYERLRIVSDILAFNQIKPVSATDERLGEFTAFDKLPIIQSLAKN